MGTKIKSANIKPNDIIRFEFGDYGNWVTARIDEVHIDPTPTPTPTPTPNTYYPLKLTWHYLSDEKEKENPSGTAALSQAGQQSAPAPSPKPYRQFTCYSNLDDIVEKLN